MPASIAADGLAKPTGLPAEPDLAARRAGRSRTGRGRPRSGRLRPARRTRRSRRARTENVMSRKTPARVRPSTSRRTSPIGVSTFGKSETVRPTMCRTRSAVVSSLVGVVMTCRPSRKTVARSHSVEDLVEPVAHEQDRHAASAELPDDREQALDLVGRERRRRLVEDQDARLDRQRLGDLDELLVGHREAADRRADVELDVELVEQRLRRPARGAPVDRAAAEPTARGR